MARQGMTSDNLDTVPSWVYQLDGDPFGVDDEPWRWTCGECGLTMRRQDIAAHREDEARRPVGALVWMLGAIGVCALVTLAVVLVRWPR